MAVRAPLAAAWPRCAFAFLRFAVSVDAAGPRRTHSNRHRRSRTPVCRHHFRSMRKRKTSWKASSSRNSGIWFPSTRWSAREVRRRSRISHNETRRSAWRQDRRSKPGAQAGSGSTELSGVAGGKCRRLRRTSERFPCFPSCAADAEVIHHRNSLSQNPPEISTALVMMLFGFRQIRPTLRPISQNWRQ